MGRRVDKKGVDNRREEIMSHLKDLAKLLAILLVLGVVAWGIYVFAKGQDPANRKRYVHPVYRVGGQK
ncbi:MAG: hypothetical protein D6794_02260 [Deltaproteobacteria bacterium]|nr:MAG: hypothetical protein D6794_02260 [Deltaproteobacteria bacterium]